MNTLSVKLRPHLLVLAASSLSLVSLAGDPVAISPVVVPAAWGGTMIGGGIKSNGGFTEGSLFMLQPLFNSIDDADDDTTEGSVVFAEPYLTWGSDEAFSASLGLGYRRLFSDQTQAEANDTKVAGFLTEGYFVGANGFLDYARSPRGSDFWQIGLGLEAGTRYLEFRANYYLPLGDEQLLERRVTTSTTERTTTRRSGNVSRATTTRTTTRTTVELFEEAMEGFDVEAAVLLPYIDRHMDVKVIGGYYDFQGDRSRASDFAGWRIGVEARPLASLVLFAHWYDRENFFDDNWIAGVRFEIPLGTNRREAFKMRRRHLAERMFEPVLRQNLTTTLTRELPEIRIEQSSTSTTKSRVISIPRPVVSPATVQPPDGGVDSVDSVGR